MSRDGVGRHIVEGLARSALDVLPVGVVLHDSTGTEVLRNGAATRLLRDDKAEALLDPVIEAVCRSEAAAPRVVELPGPSPSTLSVSAQALSGGGRAVVIEDVTERQRLDRIKRDFVANVSHELRTPVGAIVLLSETLEGESDPDAVALLQAHIGEEARRARRLVDALLVLSRVEARGPVREHAVDLADVVRSAVELVAPIASEAGIDVTVEVQGSPVVAGDEQSLVSAVANLVENAVKYSDAGSQVAVSLRLGSQVVKNPTCEISVRDSGIGIPAKDLDRVFERFYRVDRARSRGTGGAGLGLAIVRHVAESAGGSVSVTSREGQGSCFTIHLPLAAGNRPAAEVPR